MRIWEVRVGLAERELKRETVESDRQFVHQCRREIVPVTDGQILAQSVHFTQRWESGIHRRPCVQEVALLGIKRVLEPPHKDAVFGTKRVIHPHVVVGPFELRRRVPVEPRLVESVTLVKRVCSWQAIHQCEYRRISADSLRVVGKNVIAVNAVPGDRRAIAHGDARLQIAIGVHQER